MSFKQHKSAQRDGEENNIFLLMGEIFGRFYSGFDKHLRSDGHSDNKWSTKGGQKFDKKGKTSTFHVCGNVITKI